MAHFLERLGREVTTTLETFRESVIAIAERVNRKIQIICFHWETAKIHDYIDHAHQDLGHRLSDLLTDLPEGASVYDQFALREAEMILSRAGRNITVLKQDALGLDTIVRELEVEALREDLITIQHDLSSRGALIRRVTVENTGTAVNRSIPELRLSPTVRVGGILRGPLLMTSIDQTKLQSGDIVILLGSREELQRCLPLFSHVRPKS